MAPMVMMPSIPRLRTPARSQINSPKVPKIKGLAMRRVAAQKPAVVRISRISIIAAVSYPRRSRKRTSITLSSTANSDVETRTSAM